jgi:3-dehydroquinate synthase
MTAQRIITVALGDRSYDIAIGHDTLSDIGSHARRFQPSQCAVVTDETVAGLHLNAVRASFAAAGLPAKEIILPPGEATKSFDHLARLCDALLDHRLERDDLVIALGGGVIGDLAGFAAAIFKRGVTLIQVPTTLLAQVDSSIGGKTGINARQGKNLIGAFHQPSFVLIDTAVLDTLDRRQLCAGYAEVVKYGLLGDAGFFSWLEQNGAGLLDGDQKARIHAIEQSCKMKAAIVAEDEHERGRRALLNLGHTFGHALEAWAGYSATLLHGEAVAIGMVLAFEISEELGYCASGAAERIVNHLKSVGLPVSISDIAKDARGRAPKADELIALMGQDKKAKSGKLSFVLARAIGETFTTDAIETARLHGFLEKRCAI